MADNNSALGPLPNGWECKNDPRTRRNYFINYNNRTTTWDDPRVHVPLTHAPPPYQEPMDMMNMQDISTYRPSPVPGRAHTAPLMGSHAIGHHSSSKLQETSFSTAVATENSVSKIAAMFPTVSETHIRALLIKYMKSMFPKADETVILDTLYNVDNNVQAATNQLQAMGFDKRDTTPSHAGTPSSKMKVSEKSQKAEREKEKLICTPTTSARLRSVEEKQGMRDRIKKSYPDLAEQVILMALDSVDYDEKRADLILKIMIKEENTPKSTQPSSACSSQRPQSNKSEEADVSSLGTKTTIEADVMAHTPKIKSLGPKSSDEEDLKKVQQTSDTVDIALKTEGSSTLQSGSGDNGKTSKTILTNATVHPSPKKTPASNSSVQPLSNKTSIKKSKGKKEVPKISRGTSTTEDKEYRSAYRTTAAGPNPSMHHGPNDELLIEEYVTWSGPRQNTGREHTSMAKGPNKALLGCHSSAARGPNREACKGPQKGLSKGSLYSRLAACNAASTLLVVESRGK